MGGFRDGDESLELAAVHGRKLGKQAAQPAGRRETLDAGPGLVDRHSAQLGRRGRLRVGWLRRVAGQALQAESRAEQIVAVAVLGHPDLESGRRSFAGRGILVRITGSQQQGGEQKGGQCRSHHGIPVGIAGYAEFRLDTLAGRARRLPMDFGTAVTAGRPC